MRHAQCLKAIIPAALAIAAAPLLAVAASAAPRETGIHKIHAAARVGNKLCFVDHAHTGESDPFPSRRVALGAAIRKWVIFTADEYGTAWGSYAAAVGKSMTCAQGADKYWRCTTHARPCKIGK